MFGWFRKKRPAPVDPLATFDGVIEALERQGAQLRRSAATLLAVKADLTRAEERHRARLGEVRERTVQARARNDGRAAALLEADERTAARLVATTEEALAKAATDAELLLEAAAGIARELEDLQLERQSVQARLTAGALLSEGLRRRTAEVAQVLALDAARDEVERAHALAEVYRADREFPSSEAAGLQPSSPKK